MAPAWFTVTLARSPKSILISGRVEANACSSLMGMPFSASAWTYSSSHMAFTFQSNCASAMAMSGAPRLVGNMMDGGGPTSALKMDGGSGWGQGFWSGLGPHGGAPWLSSPRGSTKLVGRLRTYA